MSFTGPTGASLGWGLLGTGRIAATLAAALAVTPGAHVAAVGSRSAASAAAFADRHLPAAAARHASYADLVADERVDVVHVTSPHPFHAEHARLALEAGKPVLVEKPFAMSAPEAAAVLALAQERGLFCAEAMWTACHPVVLAVLDGLASGDWGTPRQVRADLGFVVGGDPDDRLLDPALGGSALLDQGVYGLTLAHLVLGEPEHLTGTATLDDRGVDLDVAVVGRYAGGALAAVTASMTAWTPRTASVATDRGRVDLPASFQAPPHATWTPLAGTSPETATSAGGVTLVGTAPVVGGGYGNQALEVARCLAAGATTSPLLPHARTLAVLRQLDTLRTQLGIFSTVRP